MQWLTQLDYWHWLILAIVLMILEVFAPGAFFLWLPFSRMFHIVMAPLAIAINTVWHQEGIGHPVAVTTKEES